MSTKTPLVVANYSNNRDEKILYLNKEDTPTAPAANWYILPSATQGYFNIASYSHIGEVENGSQLRMFNYVLEAQPKDKIRYAELVKNKPQQLFKIQFLQNFTLDTVYYDVNNATVTQAAPHTETYDILHPENSTDAPIVSFPVKVNDKSVYYEDTGLQITLAPNTKKFKRPSVYAENSATLTKQSKDDAIYQNKIQEIPLEDYTNELVLKPHSYAKVLITYRMFELRVPYTMVATIEYNDLSNSNVKKTATVKITGTWVGISHGDFSIYPPTMLPPRYFDIETNEELFY